MSARPPNSPPPSRRATNSMAAMSVTATARPHHDPHLHLPPLSHFSDHSHARNAQYSPYSTSNVASPNVNNPPPFSQPYDNNQSRYDYSARSQYNQSFPSTPVGYSLNPTERAFPFPPQSNFTFTAENGRYPYPNPDPNQQSRNSKSGITSPSRSFEPEATSLPLRNADTLSDRTVSHSVFSEPSYSRTSSGSRLVSSVSPKHEVSTMSRPTTDAPPSTETTRPMPISGLIDPRPEPRYSISIRQQPIAARACGFGERDRRVIDPPPILEMKVTEPGASAEELSTKLRNPYCVIHCSLWNAESDTDHTAMDEMGDRRQQRRLMGTLVASPFVGRDENNVEGCFFCFPDLSCRTTGKYRLKFVLVVLDPFKMRPGEKAPFQATIITDVFQVYAAKDFPGMRSSTELTKRLKEQGCLISVKKGIEKIGEKSTAAHGRSGSDDDDDEDIPAGDNNGNNGSSGKGREKRAKK